MGCYAPPEGQALSDVRGEQAQFSRNSPQKQAQNQTYRIYRNTPTYPQIPYFSNLRIFSHVVTINTLYHVCKLTCPSEKLIVTIEP